MTSENRTGDSPAASDEPRRTGTAANARGFELGSDGPSLLLVGLDGTDTSWRALFYAFGLARRQGGALVAVFTFTPIVAGVGCPGELWFAGKELAEELRAAVAALSAEYGVAVEFVASQRDPVAVLTELAAARHADAIVIGASGSLTHRFFGSKAVRTIRRSRCPVTVVP